MNAFSITNLTKTYANGTQASRDQPWKFSRRFLCASWGQWRRQDTIIGIMTGLVNKTAVKSRSLMLISLVIIQSENFYGSGASRMNFNMLNGCRIFCALRRGITDPPDQSIGRLRIDPQKNLNYGISVFFPSGHFRRMKRRLMIARALIKQTKILILDEPTAGVDVELRHTMWILKRLNKNGTTILLTTHYLEEVEQMCRNAAIIKNGEIISYDRVRNPCNSWRRKPMCPRGTDLEFG